MFINNDIPQGYNKLAEISDNYLVWVRESKLVSGTKYSAYIQYLKPSWLLVFTDDYMIKTGTKYSFDYNYSANGYGSYITSADYSYELQTMEPDTSSWSSDIHYRADFPEIFICGFIICVIFYWVFKNLSRLFFKGGL